MESIIWKSILVVGSMLVALAGSLGIVKWKHDNNLEQAIERYVEEQTGFEIDLSPDDEAKAEFLLRHPQIDMVQTPVHSYQDIAGI